MGLLIDILDSNLYQFDGEHLQKHDQKYTLRLNFVFKIWNKINVFLLLSIIICSGSHPVLELVHPVFSKYLKKVIGNKW